MPARRLVMPTVLVTALMTALVTALMTALMTGLALAWTSMAAPAVASERLSLHIEVTPKEPRPDVFVLKGRVTAAAGQVGDYAGGPAILQRRNCGGCSWYGEERFETDAEGRFRLRVMGPAAGQRKVCYRIKVARDATVNRTISEHHCIAPVQPTGR